MPKVTPELLREMARNEYAPDGAGLIEIGDWANGRASAFRVVANMLEAEARESAFLVIPHDPNYHCWGK